MRAAPSCGRECHRRRRCACLTWILIILAAAAPVWAQDAPREIPLAPGAEPGKPVVTVLDRHAGGLTLELAIPSLEATDVEIDGQVFQELVVPDGGFAGDIGRAALPTYTRLVALPAGVGARVALTGKRMAALPAMDLAPAQPVVDQDAGKAALRLDSAWYARAPRTEPAVTVGEPAIMHGQRVVPVTFSPLSYDPRTARRGGGAHHDGRDLVRRPRYAQRRHGRAAADPRLLREHLRGRHRRLATRRERRHRARHVPHDLSRQRERGERRAAAGRVARSARIQTRWW